MAECMNCKYGPTHGENINVLRFGPLNVNRSVQKINELNTLPFYETWWRLRNQL